MYAVLEVFFCIIKTCMNYKIMYFFYFELISCDFEPSLAHIDGSLLMMNTLYSPYTVII